MNNHGRSIALQHEPEQESEAVINLLIAICSVAHRDLRRGPLANTHYRTAYAFLKAAGALPNEPRASAPDARAQLPPIHSSWKQSHG